jgi:phenylpropionate dioxygenase-like ring-hydroxylating dioxygenase large terminal subunit
MTALTVERSTSLKETRDSSPSTNRQPMPHQSVTEILHNCIFQNDSEKVKEFNSLARRLYEEINNNDRNAENYTLRITE